MPVQMLDSLTEAEQGLLESELQLHIQIIADTLKVLVLLLADREDQIASHHVRNLLAFLLTNDRVAARYALVDFDVYRHFLRDQPVSAADWAFLSHRFAFPVALITLRLHLHLHAEAHSDVLHDLASALALRAGFHLAILSASAVALVAVNVTVDVQGAYCAQVHFL